MCLASCADLKYYVVKLLSIMIPLCLCLVVTLQNLGLYVYQLNFRWLPQVVYCALKVLATGKKLFKAFNNNDLD